MPFPLGNAEVFCPDDESIIGELLVTEEDYMVAVGYWLVAENRDHRYRAIQLIQQKVGTLGENNEYVPFLTLNYYDRFASRFDIRAMPHPEEALHITVQSCWNLAKKTIDGVVIHVPSIEDNPEVRAAENHILAALNFNLLSVTP